LLNPEYNIIKIAGATPVGFKHTEETKSKFGVHRLGVKRAEGAGSPSVQIEVLNLDGLRPPRAKPPAGTGKTSSYPSMNETGRALGVPSGSIRMYFYRIP